MEYVVMIVKKSTFNLTYIDIWLAYTTLQPIVNNTLNQLVKFPYNTFWWLLVIVLIFKPLTGTNELQFRYWG